MTLRSLTGTRIRRQRMDLGMRQAALARSCGISASYLNLIEHNKRSIGGLLLNKIAEALNTDPAMLNEGPEAAMQPVLSTAAARHAGSGAEVEKIEEFVGRFPGWANLIENQARESEMQAHLIDTLNDKLTHDPFLAAALHEMLSSVTAIRSSSAILANGDVEPEWQARFHRNIFEDAQRLAASGETLVRYLEKAEGEETPTLPQEEIDAWLRSRDWQVEDIEFEGNPDEVAINAPELTTDAARKMAAALLKQQQTDAKELPTSTLSSAISEHGVDPISISDALAMSLPIVMRRLATLPETLFPDQEPRGFAQCDGSGTLTFRKPLVEFDLPRYGSACPLWPLFQALQRPGTPIQLDMKLASREGISFRAFAFADVFHPHGYSGPAIAQAWMLFSRDRTGDTASAHPVGTSCRICSRENCPARREPSLI